MDAADIKRLSLGDPIKLGNASVVALMLEPLDAGQAIDAATDAERVAFSPKGEPVLVPSPVMATAHRARRQVRTLICDDGKDIQGPMSLSDLRRLSEPDMIALYDRCEKVDELYLEKESGRGRSHAADGGGSADGVDDAEDSAGVSGGARTSSGDIGD